MELEGKVEPFKPTAKRAGFPFAPLLYSPQLTTEGPPDAQN
jgi:hypothetical protein